MKVYKQPYHYFWKQTFAVFGFFLFSHWATSQVETRVDTTTIKIGEEISLFLEVEVDSSAVVIFPEGQSFQPLELLEAYTTDTTKLDPKIKLIKKYGLTQFDSGGYTIPQQKILINDKGVFSDSIQIQVNAVKVDTTQQKMFDIKPIIDVEPINSFGLVLKWALSLVVLLIIVFVVYKYVWKKRQNNKALEKSTLPPYEQAKKALKQLDEKKYFEDKNIKKFYSDLTFVLRQYLNEKVYNQSLESTTEELLGALKQLNASGQIDLSDETIKNIESTLKRADLVKFAKSEPEFEIISADKTIIDQEIDEVKKGLPEPTEEELLHNLKYQEALILKKKQRQLKIISFTLIGLVAATLIACSFYFGFDAVRDTVLRHSSKRLLEKEQWISSEYGAPGITIRTPEVLGRIQNDSTGYDDESYNTIAFEYSKENIPLKIIVKSSKLKTDKTQNNTKNNQIDLIRVAEKELAALQTLGASNLIPKQEQFITPNGQEGLKTYGSANFVFDKSENREAEFVILGFSTANLLQQLIIVWANDDVYTKQISEQILDSVELIKIEQQ